MKVYHNHIPSSHLAREADLVAPPGVNMSKLVEAVAAQIATTIIHEAAHGKRWAEQFYTNKQQLSNMNRSEEEQFAEQAESRANLPTAITTDIFGDSEEEEFMSNQAILRKSVQVANGKNDFFIPLESIEDASLGSDNAWGQFEMTQGPQPGSATSDPHIAWSDRDRTLKVDVEAIVDEYNRVVEMSLQQQPHPATYQNDGIEADIPGVSQQEPQTSIDAIQARPSVPAIGAR